MNVCRQTYIFGGEAVLLLVACLQASSSQSSAYIQADVYMYVLSVCIYTYTHTGACGHACIHSRLMMYLGLAREKLKCISCLFLQTPAAVHVQ